MAYSLTLTVTFSSPFACLAAESQVASAQSIATAPPAIIDIPKANTLSPASISSPSFDSISTPAQNTTVGASSGTAGTPPTGAATTKIDRPVKLQEGKPMLAAPAPPASPNGSSPAVPGLGTGMGTGTVENKEADANKPTMQDDYPQVGKMEYLVFVKITPQLPLTERLTRLEMAIFRKASPELALSERTEKLEQTLLGTTGGADPNAPKEITDMSSVGWIPAEGSNLSEAAIKKYFSDLLEKPEAVQEANKQDLIGFALDEVNNQRQLAGVGVLKLDELASRLAHDHVADLSARAVISHINQAGDNPDRRYTVAGGTDAMCESIEAVNYTDLAENVRATKACRAMVATLLQEFMLHQDDRDALLSSDATGFGFDFQRQNNGSKLIGCLEVITKHGSVGELPNQVGVGQKINVQGVLDQGYNFDHVSIAWEGLNPGMATATEVDEALPYFPPLDYIAFAKHSNKDYSTAITTLKIIGIAAAIAGGMFMPPVAFAAPLIAMAGPGPGLPKPASDIPIHGGVKVDHNLFSGHINLTHEGKEGIYYVTVWATRGEDTRPIAISRRALIATGAPIAADNAKEEYREDLSGKVEDQGNNATASAQASQTGGNSAKSVKNAHKQKHKHHAKDVRNAETN